MKWLTILVAAMCSFGVNDASGEESLPAGKLTVIGTVLMPDGSPAVDAVVSACDIDEPPTVVRTGHHGDFQIRGEFTALGCRLHARSTDGKSQTAFRISEVLARTSLAKPVEMKLVPALERLISVAADRKPVAGAHVVVEGFNFRAEEISDAAGQVNLRFPANDPVRDLVAWHATLGIAGIGFSKHRLPTSDRIPHTGAQLSLLAPRSHIVRVVDADDQPVPAVKLLANIQFAVDWTLASCVPAAAIVTGTDGRATVEWCPRECQWVSLNRHIRLKRTVRGFEG